MKSGQVFGPWGQMWLCNSGQMTLCLQRLQASRAEELLCPLPTTSTVPSSVFSPQSGEGTEFRGPWKSRGDHSDAGACPAQARACPSHSLHGRASAVSSLEAAPVARSLRGAQGAVLGACVRVCACAHTCVTASLGYNSPSIQSLHLRYIIQLFLLYSHIFSCTSVLEYLCHFKWGCFTLNPSLWLHPQVSSPHTFYHPSPRQSLIFLPPQISLFWTFHIYGIIQHAALCDWRLSLSIILSRFTTL